MQLILAKNSCCYYCCVHKKKKAFRVYTLSKTAFLKQPELICMKIRILCDYYGHYALLHTYIHAS